MYAAGRKVMGEDATLAVADQNLPAMRERSVGQASREHFQVAAPRRAVELACREGGDEINLGERGPDRHIVIARGDAETHRAERSEEQPRHPEHGVPDN